MHFALSLCFSVPLSLSFSPSCSSVPVFIFFPLRLRLTLPLPPHSTLYPLKVARSFDYANRAGADYIAFVAPAEWATGSVRIKDLRKEGSVANKFGASSRRTACNGRSTLSQGRLFLALI